MTPSCVQKVYVVLAVLATITLMTTCLIVIDLAAESKQPFTVSLDQVRLAADNMAKTSQHLDRFLTDLDSARLVSQWQDNTRRMSHVITDLDEVVTEFEEGVSDFHGHVWPRTKRLLSKMERLLLHPVLRLGNDDQVDPDQ